MKRDLLIIGGIGSGIWLTFGPHAAAAVFLTLTILLAVLSEP